MFSYSFNPSDVVAEFFILVIGFSIWLTYKFVGRTKNEENGAGCIVYGYVFAVAFCLSMFAFGIILGISKSVYSYFSLPKYEAVVIDNHTYQEKKSSTISSSRSFQREVTMYQPIVHFLDSTGKEVKILTDISSNEPKEIGSKINIGYREGMETAEEFSFIKLFLMLGLIFIGGACIFFLLWATFYALGRDTTGIKIFGQMVVSFFILPVGMLGLLSAFTYILYEHFMGMREALPLWVVILLIFFSVMLFFSILGYIKDLFSPNEEISDEDIEDEDDIS